jgi:hypothetical protein
MNRGNTRDVTSGASGTGAGFAWGAAGTVLFLLLQPNSPVTPRASLARRPTWPRD